VNVARIVHGRSRVKYARSIILALFTVILLVGAPMAQAVASTRTGIVNIGCVPLAALVADGINDRAAELASRRGVVAGRLTVIICRGQEFGGTIRQPSGHHVPFNGAEGSDAIFRKMFGQ
jgi:hypothetical protein